MLVGVESCIEVHILWIVEVGVLVAEHRGGVELARWGAGRRRASKVGMH